MTPTGIAILLGFAILFYRAAESEDRSGILWGCGSSAAFMAAVYFQTGWFGVLAGQAIVYLAMWIANCLRRRVPHY